MTRRVNGPSWALCHLSVVSDTETLKRKKTPGQAATPNRGALKWDDYEGRRITSRDSLAGVE